MRNTIMFVETPGDSGKMIVGFTLHKLNYLKAPKGIIRIARFDNAFWPEKNYGYYADIYFRKFIRKWKKITYQNIQRRHDTRIANKILQHSILPTDINNIIISFI